MTTQVEEVGRDPLLLERVRNARQLRQAHEKTFMEAVRHAVANRGGYTVREIPEAAGISRERAYQIMGG